MEVSVWPDTTWAGRMEGPKLVIYTFLLNCSGGSFLGSFSAMAGFFNGVAWHGLTKGCSGYNLGL